MQAEVKDLTFMRRIDFILVRLRHKLNTILIVIDLNTVRMELIFDKTLPQLTHGQV